MTDHVDKGNINGNTVSRIACLVTSQLLQRARRGGGMREKEGERWRVEQEV